MPRATWFATIAGSAIHEITEQWDRFELMGLSPQEQVLFSPSFAEVFTPLLDEAEAEGTEVKPSGRVTKEVTESGGPNKKDRDWWLHWGPIYLQRWMAWKAEFGWKVMTMPDGLPGIELGFDITVGGERVVGFIDRVYESDQTGITVFDLKSGAVPAGSLQLKTYDLGLKGAYGIEADWGMFWSPGGDDKGKLSSPVDLRSWPDERVEDMYYKAMRGIEAGIFLPQVTSMCRGCTVRRYCWAVAGEKAEELPLVAEVAKRETGELASTADAQVEQDAAQAAHDPEEGNG